MSSCWATIVSSESILSPFVVLHVDPDGRKQKNIKNNRYTLDTSQSSPKAIGGALLYKKDAAFLEKPFLQNKAGKGSVLFLQPRESREESLLPFI